MQNCLGILTTYCVFVNSGIIYTAPLPLLMVFVPVKLCNTSTTMGILSEDLFSPHSPEWAESDHCR